MSTGYIVDPEARLAWEAGSAPAPLSDALSDAEAPPRTLVRFRGGAKECVACARACDRPHPCHKLRLNRG